MNKQDLQITAGRIIYEAKMSTDSKKQLLNFVESQATEQQIMALLLDGEVISLDEKSAQIVEDRFKASAIGLLVTELTGLEKIAVSAGVVIVAANIYKNFFSKMGKKCKGFGAGQKRVDCLTKVKREAKQKQIAALKSGISKCSKDKNPERCKNKILKKISTLSK